MFEWLFRRRKKEPKPAFVCVHKYPPGAINLCMKWGCPDDPNWKGDGCA